MTKKQKKMLIRICIAIVLLLIAKFVPMPGAVRIVLFAVTYLVIGYDILKKRPPRASATAVCSTKTS